MAKQRLTALSDLKRKFGHFKELEECMADLDRLLTEIDDKNANAAGHGEVGEAYRTQVEKGTTGLHEITNSVKDALGNTWSAGAATTDVLNQADQDNNNTAKNW
ncbi:hypothetical protein ACF07Y_37055 [Streptomyces sp. NPDC016566]|uniref:hypothetical protein n=1 Tax=Streptomyces sp. NPDC016566 TaxID=3364967 RepID=UPI0036F51A4E